MKLDYEISFIPEWRNMELLRNSIEAVLEAVVANPDQRAAVTMVSAELMENAFKHGDCGISPIDFKLVMDDGEGSVVVANTWSKARAANIDQLMTTAQWIEGFSDPLDAYIERMKLLYESANPSASGLGLVRVVYEGQCTLACTVEREPKRVEVKATFRKFANPGHL